jgi:hypothetical protein
VSVHLSFAQSNNAANRAILGSGRLLRTIRTRPITKTSESAEKTQIVIMRGVPLVAKRSGEMTACASRCTADYVVSQPAEMSSSRCGRRESDAYANVPRRIRRVDQNFDDLLLSFQDPRENH